MLTHRADTGGASGLAEFQSIVTENQRVMEVARRGPPWTRSRFHQHPGKAELTSGRREEIGPACDQRNSLTKIVNGDGKLVRPLPMAIPDEEVAALVGRRLRLGSEEQIVEVLGSVGQLKSKAGARPLGHAPVAAAAGVALAADVGPRAVARVDMEPGAKPIERQGVHIVVLALPVDPLSSAAGVSPQKPEPVEVLEDRPLELVAAAHPIVVFDTQHDRSAERPGEAPDVDRIHDMPEVQVPCRRWGIPRDRSGAAERGGAT